jgi:hypothetical protein
MSLAHQLDRAGFTAEQIEAFTDVRLQAGPAETSIAEISLTCEAVVPAIDDKSFQESGYLAKHGLLTARALAAVPRTMTARDWQGGERAGSGGADAAAGPGDDRDLAFRQPALAAGPAEACSVSI